MGMTRRLTRFTAFTLRFPFSVISSQSRASLQRSFGFTVLHWMQSVE